MYKRQALTRSGVFKEERLGVHVLYSPCSSYTLHTRAGSSMEELYPQEAFFAGLLPAMGVPYAYTGSAELTGQIEMCIRDRCSIPWALSWCWVRINLWTSWMSRAYSTPEEIGRAHV